MKKNFFTVLLALLVLLAGTPKAFAAVSINSGVASSPQVNVGSTVQIIYQVTVSAPDPAKFFGFLASVSGAQQITAASCDVPARCSITLNSPTTAGNVTVQPGAAPVTITLTVLAISTCPQSPNPLVSTYLEGGGGNPASLYVDVPLICGGKSPETLQAADPTSRVAPDLLLGEFGNSTSADSDLLACRIIRLSDLRKQFGSLMSVLNRFFSESGIFLAAQESSEEKTLYQKALVDLPPGDLTIGDASLAVIARALASDMSDGKASPSDQTVAILQAHFKSRFGAPFTSADLSEVRTFFYTSQNKPLPDLSPLPEHFYFGACTGDAFREVYFGPFAKTGPKGTKIHCGLLTIVIPPETYLIHFFQFPKIGALTLVKAYRLDTLRDFRNTLFIGPEGEEILRLLVQSPMGPEEEGQLRFIVSEQQRLIRKISSVPFRLGRAEINILPREYSGDEVIVVEISR